MKTKRLAYLFVFSVLFTLGSFSIVFADALQTGIDAYTKQDFKTAYKVFKELAQQGNLDAQNNLGIMYFQKQGLPEGITEFERLRGARWWWNAGAENAEKSGNTQTNIKLKMNISQINHQHGLLKAEIEEFLKTKKCEKCWIGDSGLKAMMDYDLSDLSGVDLSGSNLRSWGLVHSNLSGADLSGADLSNADLRQADLTGADLTGAILTGATLRGAKWRTAKISGTILVKILAEEKIAQERLAAEKVKQEKLAAEKAKQKKLAEEKIAQEKLAAEKAYQERRAEEEKAYRERRVAERERRAAERAEKKRLAAERAEGFEPDLLAMEKSRFIECQAFINILRTWSLFFDGTHNEATVMKEYRLFESVAKSRQIAKQELALAGGKLNIAMEKKYGSDNLKALEYLDQKTVECGGESKQIAAKQRSPKEEAVDLLRAAKTCRDSASGPMRRPLTSFLSTSVAFLDAGDYRTSIGASRDLLRMGRRNGISNCNE